eukprot:CAMPEP_0201534276 /NCGR_PEP_ID=MMETSP0161_2-20130828/55802_1 /ASSEMBLY_ACC=CAM_ASM_000251 /TAXON_ID=180227 /ORGANISM="Neoparamoeba aestuarina, Strain SoJaBio B1-5/56/2" /LENGTH=398 /DNA_ID=CAMNT_0047938821 /DNA_START=204 /DNA_END=1396 /DNA_ORIENTATION=-
MTQPPTPSLCPSPTLVPIDHSANVEGNGEANGGWEKGEKDASKEDEGKAEENDMKGGSKGGGHSPTIGKGPEIYGLEPLLQAFFFQGRVDEKPTLDKSWELNPGDVETGVRIGVGSFAEVYKGRWRGVTVAVKILLPSKNVDNVKLAASFASEVSLMSKLHHPNILTFYGACSRPPNLFMVVEWMSRGDLFSIIKDPYSQFTRFSLSFRLQLAYQCALGIDYMHSLIPPVIHRDLKSLNLLVGEKWEIRISDFGLSTVKSIYQDNGSAPTLVGTPAWAAPEVLLREGYSESADIYSFGVILWEVVTKKRPYGRMSPTSIMAKIHQRPLMSDIPQNTPKPVIDLLDVCMSLTPDDRPRAADVVSLLQNLLDADLEEEKEIDLLGSFGGHSPFWRGRKGG